MKETAHILVVDDDREIRTLLRDYLEKNGFRTSAVADGNELRRALDRTQFDLIVLDLMLPHESGVDICRMLRESSDIPIIMLTALDDEVDRVVGLEVGADDYVPKPFSPRELLGRIRAVLRRTMQGSKRRDSSNIHHYRFADWTLDTTSRTLTKSNGESVPLGGAEYRVLSILLANAPCVVPRAQLTEEGRGREFDPLDRSIDVRVSRLRQTLGDEARVPRIIKTIYGEGYSLGVAVEADEK